MDRQERAGFYAVVAAVSDEVLNEASRFGKELNFLKLPRLKTEDSL